MKKIANCTADDHLHARCECSQRCDGCGEKNDTTCPGCGGRHHRECEGPVCDGCVWAAERPAEGAA